MKSHLQFVKVYTLITVLHHLMTNQMRDLDTFRSYMKCLVFHVKILLLDCFHMRFRVLLFVEGNKNQSSTLLKDHTQPTAGVLQPGSISSPPRCAAAVPLRPSAAALWMLVYWYSVMCEREGERCLAPNPLSSIMLSLVQALTCGAPL